MDGSSQASLSPCLTSSTFVPLPKLFALASGTLSLSCVWTLLLSAVSHCPLCAGASLQTNTRDTYSVNRKLHMCLRLQLDFSSIPHHTFSSKVPSSSQVLSHETTVWVLDKINFQLFLL